MTTLAVSIRRLIAADLAGYKVLRDAVLAAHPLAFTSDAAPRLPAESYRSRLGTYCPEDGVFLLGA